LYQCSELSATAAARPFLSQIGDERDHGNVTVRPTDLTDAELLARTPTEIDTFAIFYRRHVDWVLRVSAHRTRNREHASDLTAEVFASALLGAGRFRPERADGAANNWLFGILLHKLAGFERRGAVERRGRRRLRMREPVMSDDDFDRILREPIGGPDVLRLLERLPSAERDAVRARVIDERSYPELAAQLQITESNARKRVSRGLAALRAELAKEGS
jgi:RNA polymerase sigma-70 factor (ECF subfamily)